MQAEANHFLLTFYELDDGKSLVFMNALLMIG